MKETTWLYEEITYKCPILRDVPNTRIASQLHEILTSDPWNLNLSERTVTNWTKNQKVAQLIENPVRKALDILRERLRNTAKKTPLNSPLEL